VAKECRERRCEKEKGGEWRRVVLLASTTLWKFSELVSRVLKRVLAQAETKQVRSREVMEK
jgi:hypothetical protein